MNGSQTSAQRAGQGPNCEDPENINSARSQSYSNNLSLYLECVFWHAITVNKRYKPSQWCMSDDKIILNNLSI
jgi:hypothetical protein